MIRFAVFCVAVVSLGWAGTTRVGMAQPADWNGRIDSMMAAGIEQNLFPGCVVCIGNRAGMIRLSAHGNLRNHPAPVAMKTDTVFDLASLTKPVATATSIMKLVERGKLRLDERVAAIFPEFAANGKESITIRDLLLHRSGLIPDNPLEDYLGGPEQAWRKICELSPLATPGKEFRYSDVNYIVLGKTIESLTNAGLDEFSKREIFHPLGMTETCFNPERSLSRRAAVTERRDGKWIQGEVHDPRAFALGGVAGHAGLFSTAGDLAKYAIAMLQAFDDRQADGTRILSPATIRLMSAGVRMGRDWRALGWDKRTGYSSNRGDLMSESAFGHGGFTGTAIWIDPRQDLFVIFLSNRLHAEGESRNINPFIGKLVNLAVSGLPFGESGFQPRVSKVLTGIDVLQRDDFRQLAGKRIGLITNQTGRNREGVSTARILQCAAGVNLTTLFSPEHGYAGDMDIERIGDSTDPETGLAVYSLYGETRRPTAQMLENVDMIVFDIQDIGTRFYTYISTMGEAMRAASEHGKSFMVLDRPNPVGGLETAGPMLDAGTESFVGYFRLPIRHGLTVGELAMMLRDELKLELGLEVIPCEGWSRDQWWDRTGLEWVNPSPNMRSLNQAILYPGIGLFETTNLSVGRGTDTPFEILGAPWMDGRRLSQQLNDQGIPGVVFVPIRFTPRSSKFANESCSGINVVIVNRETFEPVETGLRIAVELRRLHRAEWQAEKFGRLLGNKAVMQLFLEGASVESLLESSRAGVEEFRRRRTPWLIYD